MDVTGSILTATTPVTPPSAQASSAMPPLAAFRTAASAARTHVRATLATWELDHLTDTTVAIVSELVANAVNASADEDGRPLRRDGRMLMVRVRLHAYGLKLLAEVWDQAPGVPALKDADDTAESGRGLALVRDFSDAWGWYPLKQQPGKCVWAAISGTPLAIPDPKRADGNALCLPAEASSRGSRAEGAPVTHDHYKSIGLDAPERGNYGSA